MTGAPVVFELPLPWSSPPLSLNHRRSRWATAKLTRTVRDVTHVLARRAWIGRHERVQVALHYRPRDRRVRDVENPVSTLKACCDGLVDAGVVADDDPAHMIKDMPVIHPPASPARLWLVVTPLSTEATA